MLYCLNMQYVQNKIKFEFKYLGILNYSYMNPCKIVEKLF